MNEGKIEQMGRPKDVYEEPNTTFVASFLGISNLISGNARAATGDRCVVEVGEFELHARQGSITARGDTKLMIRPERVRLEPHGSGGENRIPGIVERVVYRGNATRCSSAFLPAIRSRPWSRTRRGSSPAPRGTR